jgi:glutamyl-tRNA reductase
VIVVVGLSHRTAPVAIREKLAVAPSDLPATLNALRQTLDAAEIVLLSTCNRVEWFAVPRQVTNESALSLCNQLIAHIESMVPEARSHLYVHEDLTSIEHLFRVAASLDSLVIGEPQILGQMKDAFATARTAKTLGPWLHRAFEHAFRVAKRVRTETALGTGQVSVPTVAVDLAKEIFGEIEGRKVTLVGTGEMASSVAILLGRAGARVSVIGRTLEHTQVLAHKIGAKPQQWDELAALLGDSDIVISSTSARDYVITLEHLKETRRKRQGRSLFLVDLAVPRDVDPRVADLDGVFLYNIDDLSQVANVALADRAHEAEMASAIVVNETQAYQQRVHAERITPTVVELRERFRAVLESEFEHGLHNLHPALNETQQKAMRRIIAAGIEKLLHGPTEHLRLWAKDSEFGEWHTDLLLMAVRSLFNLEAAKQTDEATRHDVG